MLNRMHEKPMVCFNLELYSIPFNYVHPGSKIFVEQCNLQSFGFRIPWVSYSLTCPETNMSSVMY